jgi:hypothetical protein
MSTQLFFFALDVIGFFSVLLFGLNGHTASTTQGSAFAQFARRAYPSPPRYGRLDSCPVRKDRLGGYCAAIKQE